MTYVAQPLVSAAEQFGLEANWTTEAARALDQESPIEALQAIDHAARQLAHMQKYAVALARTKGETWEAIAKALKMTRQGAHQRFGEVTPSR